MDTQKLDKMNDLFIRYVKESIDFLVADGDDEFPVISQVLVKSGVATHKQLDILEEQGHIKSVTIEVPSILIPTKTVPEKAYYTEKRIPALVTAKL